MLGFEKLVLSKVPPFGWIWNVQSSFFVFLETMFLSDNIVKRASLHACLCALPPHLLTLRRISSAAANTIRSWKHAHRNCRATDATIHQPPKHVYKNKQSVALHVTSTSENAPWCNMSTVQSLIELPKVARQNTHTLKAPSTQQFHCAKSPRDGKKNKARECKLQPKSPGRGSSTERKRAMTCKTLKHESKIKNTDRNHLDAMVKPLRATSRPWKCARRTLMQHFHRAKTHWVARKHKTTWCRGCVRLRCCEV